MDLSVGIAVESAVWESNVLSDRRNILSNQETSMEEWNVWKQEMMGSLPLKTNTHTHKYYYYCYYYIQCQMNTCNALYADYVVWTEANIYMERIERCWIPWEECTDCWPHFKNIYISALLGKACQLRTNSYLQWQPTPAKHGQHWGNCALPNGTPKHSWMWYSLDLN
jgi:hypothetical protein